MPPFSYRLRFLIPRHRLPHTPEDEPHILDVRTGQTELHVRQGSGNRPDELIVRKAGIADGEQALEEALEFKRSLMRTGLVTGVPMLFGNDTSSTRLGEALVDRVRERTGATPRPDVHGVEVIDEGEGPAVHFQMEAAGHVTTPAETFLGELSESLDTRPPSFALDGRVALAIQVFMAAATERTTHVRFLQLVTALEILAEQRPTSDVGTEIIEAALAQLAERRGELEADEAQSLQTALGRLRNESIGRSVRALGMGLDPDTIDGYRGGDVGRFLGRCYSVRSTLVHEGVAPTDSDLAQLTGNLDFLLRQILIRLVDRQ